MRIYTRKIISNMWALGMPSTDARYANIYRAAIKAGLSEKQAWAIVKDAYNANKGFVWLLPEGLLRDATEEREAIKFPNGKCAEDRLARAEGRPSRWNDDQ